MDYSNPIITNIQFPFKLLRDPLLKFLFLCTDSGVCLIQNIRIADAKRFILKGYDQQRRPVFTGWPFLDLRSRNDRPGFKIIRYEEPGKREKGTKALMQTRHLPRQTFYFKGYDQQRPGYS